jgi:NAD+ synthase
MLKGLTLDCERERARIVAFIREQLAAAGYSRVVLGLSGGLDSALTAALSVQALGAANVHAVIMPHRTSNPESELHATAQARALGLDPLHFDISDVVEPYLAADPTITDLRRGNLMARARMMTLFDQAAALRALVAGTSNRTEYLLGYFTMFGDSAASFEPLMHLYKCHVKALSRHVGVLEVILNKAPSADLWPGQTDEGELGYTYAEADAILYLLTERALPPPEVAARGYTLATVEAVQRKMRSTAFKRVPPPFLSTDGRHSL